MNVWTRCCFCLAVLAFVAASARAQPGQADLDKRSYVPFEIDKNAADIVKKRLQLDKDLGPFKEILNQVLQNPKNLDPELLKKLAGMKVQDEKLQRAVQEMLKNDPKLKKDLQEWVNKNKAVNPREDVKQSLTKLGEILKEPSKLPISVKPIELPSSPAPKEPPKTDESIGKSIANAMKKAENSDLGDWLKTSPAWQQAFRDLRTSLDNPQASKWKLGDWPGKLLAPDGKAWKLGEESLARLKDLPRPDLEKWSTKVSLPGLGNIPTPNLGPPALPNFNAPSLPSLGAGVTWLLLAALCVLTGWQMMRWSKRPTASIDWRASLGPWPVQPDAVATRGELVQAFDYLAILTLGHDAASWNHQAVARRWCANSPLFAPTANSLAWLYEQARYTDGAPELAPPQRDRARQALKKLAEAP